MHINENAYYSSFIEGKIVENVIIFNYAFIQVWNNMMAESSQYKTIPLMKEFEVICVCASPLHIAPWLTPCFESIFQLVPGALPLTLFMILIL